MKLSDSLKPSVEDQIQRQTLFQLTCKSGIENRILPSDTFCLYSISRYRFPTRREVDNENFARLAKLPGETRVYIAKDHGNSQVLEHCIAPTRLILKVGAQVMLVKNIEKTLVNGLMGIVRGFSGQGDDKMPIVEFSDGTTMTITEKTWEFEQPSEF
jgi:ATP-dependent DNA helicase PIF1